MKRLTFYLILLCVSMIVQTRLVTAQVGRDWMTDQSDAQRSAWIRNDAKINPDAMKRPADAGGFQFLWKMKLRNQPRQLNSLMPPATLDRLIGYRGFRMLGFVAGSSNQIFTIDTDLGRLEWEKKLIADNAASPGTLACPGGMTTSVVRRTLTAIPALRVGGGGRSNPAKSGVGEPGQGAVTLANVRPRPPEPPPAPKPASTPAPPPVRQFGAGMLLIHALTSDGMFHSLHLSNGAAYEPPVRFLPPNANASGLIVLDHVAYVVTTNNCGGAANGVWALDLFTKQVTTWKGNVVGSVGAAFGDDGTVFVTTSNDGEMPNTLVALDSKSLTMKAAWSASGLTFSSSPVIFTWKEKTMIAAATTDGRVHLFDSANLKSGPLASTAATLKAANFMPGALTSWHEANGTRWILAATAGNQSAEIGFGAANGAITNGAVVAWKIVEQNNSLTLQPGWASRDLMSPLSPTIINGVVFAVSSGEHRTSDSRMTAAQRAARSSPAIVYALNGATGKELWSSGKTVTSFARGAAISGGMSQIYLTTYDGTIYAFGFPMEH